jgi:hypothetical protein
MVLLLLVARHHNLMLACPKDAFVTSALKKSPPWNTLALVTTAERDAIDVRTAMNLKSFVEFSLGWSKVAPVCSIEIRVHLRLPRMLTLTSLG